jgi:hypothetical protein
MLRYATGLAGAVLIYSTAFGHDLAGLGHKSIELSNNLQLEAIVRFAEGLPDSDERYVYSRLLLWKPGQVLKGCFLDGTEEEKKFVVTAADELLQGKQVNISFDFGSSPGFRSCQEAGRRGDVRITFSQGCCAAYLGRTSHHASVENGASVFLQNVTTFEDRKALQTAMHELMHTLGLNHEHQSPDITCESEFIKDKVLQDYGWSDAQYQTNLAQLDHDSRSYKWSTYDPDSIMKYFFDPSLLKNGTASVCYSGENYWPSQRDYEGLRDAYPVRASQPSGDRSRSILEGIDSLPVPETIKAQMRELRQIKSDEND